MSEHDLEPHTHGLSIFSRDLDEARVLGDDLYHTHQVTVLGRPADFAMHIEAARLGPVTIGWLWWDTHVRVRTPPFESAYHVNVPIRGEVNAACGPSASVATTSRAHVYRCD